MKKIVNKKHIMFTSFVVIMLLLINGLMQMNTSRLPKKNSTSKNVVKTLALNEEDVPLATANEQKFEVQIIKIDIFGKEVTGATLTLVGIDENGETIYFSGDTVTEGDNGQLINSQGETLMWRSGTSAFTFLLEPGTYTLSEYETPEGYEKATDMTFTLDANGTVFIEGEPVDDNTIQMIDDVISSEPPKVAKITFDVTKTIIGEIPKKYDYAPFEFVLSAKDDAPMPSGSGYSSTENTYTITLEKDKTKASFPEISYNQEGTYEYTVTELAKDTKGFTYDSTKYDIVVTVDDDINATYTVNGDNNGAISFTNKYNPTPTSIIFDVLKNIVGKIPEDYEYTPFEFVLSRKDNSPMPEGYNEEDNSYTIKLNKDETKISFPKIDFTTIGTYHYSIKEINKGDKRFTYDDTEYDIVVTVVDNGGELKATYSVDGEESKELSFSNKYTPEPDTPNTLDNVIKYVITAIISLVSIVGVAIFIKKTNKKI